VGDGALAREQDASPGHKFRAEGRADDGEACAGGVVVVIGAWKSAVMGGPHRLQISEVEARRRRQREERFAKPPCRGVDVVRAGGAPKCQPMGVADGSRLEARRHNRQERFAKPPPASLLAL
jgi:hypothetical protein